MSVRPNHKMIHVDIDKIYQNENSRLNYNETDLSELMFSMKDVGLLEPIGLWHNVDDDTYEIVYGNRRFMAAKKLGWTDIDAVEVDIENENDRDILNLIENLKRRNTSVAEEGRMFEILKRRGMTTKEIATRLDVNPIRVQNALDVLKDVPENLLNKIVNVDHGGNFKSKGHISAGSAHKIIKAAHHMKLKKEATNSLLGLALEEGVSTNHIVEAATRVKEGTPIEEVMEEVQQLKVLTFKVFIKKRTMDKLEKKYKQSIHEIVYDKLEESALGLKRISTRGAFYSPRSTRVNTDTKRRWGARTGRGPGGRVLKKQGKKQALAEAV